MTEAEFDAYLLDGFHDPAIVAEFKAWLNTRPACVQALAREFPIGTTIEVDGEVLHLVGYTENDMLIATSKHRPTDEELEATKQYICAAHVR